MKRLTGKSLRRFIFEAASTAGSATYDYDEKAKTFTHKDGKAKDPYVYGLVGGTKGKDIQLKIAKKLDTSAKGTVGAKFKIDRNSLGDPNIQSLYGSIILALPEYKIDKDDQAGKKQSTVRASTTGDFAVQPDIPTAVAEARAQITSNITSVEGTKIYPEGSDPGYDSLINLAYDKKLDDAIGVPGTMEKIRKFERSSIALQRTLAEFDLGGSLEKIESVLEEIGDVASLYPVLDIRGEGKDSFANVVASLKVGPKAYIVTLVPNVRFNSKKSGGASSPGGVDVMSDGGEKTLTESYFRKFIKDLI